ncbi:head maturation protease, ClpP-related [Niallia nealsonii]|uniref:ATP-dependent Clp protease proteolytic subunit n=1 Tax=Niallia nealsonii TaxID=115979 RepID=A0A2N0Z359_9BACI|nr:head maturation protease, ClpP-related [Niallia nealsonii]PKG23940.1 Clp protease ClpP [Niallia nealsonii]
MKIRRYKNEQYNKLAEITPKFKAEAKEDMSSLTIYGDIGESWWGDSISASQIERALKDIQSDTIHVHLNSGGGDVFDGIAIYNQLKNHSAKIVIHVEGLAASAASLILMAADEAIIYTGAMVMIHEASTGVWGTKADIKKTLNALEGIDKSLADIYMTRFQGERAEVEKMIENETWFTAGEAVDIGLADIVDEKEAEPVEEDPEEFKNSVLEKIRNRNGNKINNQVTKTNNSILDKFKRVSNE